MRHDKTSVHIQARDGFMLSAIHFEPRGPVRAAVQVHACMGIAKEVYAPFCAYLAEAGYAAVVFDYRGIGGSRPAGLKGMQASLSDWGRLDMTGVLDWLTVRYAGHHRFIVAHGTGAQLIGLMDNHHAVDGIVAVAGTMGNWRNFSGLCKPLGLLLWLLILPLASRLLGYVPLKKIGVAEDLPRGVAKEWHCWCRRNEHHSALMERQGQSHWYHRVRVPIKAYYLEHDVLATLRSIPHFRRDFINAPMEVEILTEHDAGGVRVGHRNFFSSGHRDTLWKKALGVLGKWCRAGEGSRPDEAAAYTEPLPMKETRTGDPRLIPSRDRAKGPLYDMDR